MKSTNCSTKAVQPKSQFSSGKSAHEASTAWFLRAPLLRKGHVTTNPRQLRQSNLKGVVKKIKKKKEKREKKDRGKNNGIKNGVFIDNNVTQILGLELGMKRKQVKLYKGVQTSEGEEGERASAGVFCSPE